MCCRDHLMLSDGTLSVAVVSGLWNQEISANIFRKLTAIKILTSDKLITKMPIIRIRHIANI